MSLVIVVSAFLVGIVTGRVTFLLQGRGFRDRRPVTSLLMALALALSAYTGVVAFFGGLDAWPG